MHIVGLPADPSRNFTLWNWVPLSVHAQPHLRRAPHPPIVHFDFHLACERTWVQFTHCPSGLPRRLSNTKKEDSCGCPLRLVSWSQVERWASRLACEVVFIYVFVKPYLRGQNGGAITWPVVFSWVPAQVSRMFSFPKEKRQSFSLPAMSVERRTDPLYSRQALSRVQRLAAWGLGSSSQGQCSEDATQGRGCGEGGEESQWTRDPGRFRRNPCSWRAATTSFQAGQQRRVVQVEMEQDQSHEFWVLWTEVRGFCGGTAQRSRDTYLLGILGTSFGPTGLGHCGQPPLPPLHNMLAMDPPTSVLVGRSLTSQSDY